MYKYTKEDMFYFPKTYQYSKIDNNFLQKYYQSRKNFFKKIALEQDFDTTIELYSKEEILKRQKKFEVKKRLNNDYDTSAKEMIFFTYNLSVYLKMEFCYSLFSTFLKVNDYLLSIKEYSYNKFELSILKKVLEFEIEIVKRLENED